MLSSYNRGNKYPIFGKYTLWLIYSADLFKVILHYNQF